MLTYKPLNNLAPVYLQNLIKTKYSLESLRIFNDKTLLNESFSQNNFKSRRFSVAGPKFWNELPRRIREAISLNHFKSELKTHLFTQF